MMLVICVLLSPLAARGGEQHADAPSEELLEFLADWETRDGEWISPESLRQWTEPENKLAPEDKHGN